MASPTQRRAALAPLDANSTVSVTSAPLLAGKMGPMERLPPSPPGSADNKTRKHVLPHGVCTTPSKKVCLAGGNAELPTPEQQPAQTAAATPAPGDVGIVPASAATAAATLTRTAASRASPSPAPSSIFDTSTLGNTFQSTTATELAVEPTLANASSRTRAQTREQSRQKAEILKLRLRLAQYKLRTGQIDVPLEHLRVVPIAAAAAATVATAAAAASVPQRHSEQAWSRRSTPVPVTQARRELTAGDWIRRQQGQQEAGVQVRPARPGPPSSRGGRHVQDSDSEDDDGEDNDESDDDDVIDSQPLPQQRRPQLDAIDSVEDGYVSEEHDHGLPDQKRSVYAHHTEDSGVGLRPQLPQILRLSPSKKPVTTPLTSNAAVTPRGKQRFDDDESHIDRLTSSAMRGSAVSGLLSLAEAR